MTKSVMLSLSEYTIGVQSEQWLAITTEVKDMASVIRLVQELGYYPLPQALLLLLIGEGYTYAFDIAF